MKRSWIVGIVFVLAVSQIAVADSPERKDETGTFPSGGSWRKSIETYPTYVIETYNSTMTVKNDPQNVTTIRTVDYLEGQPRTVVKAAYSREFRKHDSTKTYDRLMWTEADGMRTFEVCEEVHGDGAMFAHSVHRNDAATNQIQSGHSVTKYAGHDPEYQQWDASKKDWAKGRPVRR